MIGSMEEARELYDALGPGLWGDLPEGWERIGKGGTRVVYKSPSNVCYKICYRYDNDKPSANDLEHNNFRKIARSKNLRPGWRVPKSYLHVFSCDRNWARNEGVIAREGTRVAILACEYIKGVGGSFACDDWTNEYSWEAQDAFFDVGLTDVGPHNAIRSEDGTWYIIDAAEDSTILE